MTTLIRHTLSLPFRYYHNMMRVRQYLMNNGSIVTSISHDLMSIMSQSITISITLSITISITFSITLLPLISFNTPVTAIRDKSLLMSVTFHRLCRFNVDNVTFCVTFHRHNNVIDNVIGLTVTFFDRLVELKNLLLR